MRQQFERWLLTDRPWWQNHLYAAAITSLLGMLLWRMGPLPGFPRSLVMLFAVVISAFIGGLGSGLISTAICVVIASPMLLHLSLSAAPGSLLPATSWLIAFVLLGVAISLLLETVRRSAHHSVASQRLHLSTLANVSDAIVTTDTQGRIEYVNRAAVGLLKRELDEVAGQRFEDVVDIRDVDSGVKSVSLTERVRTASATVHAGTWQVLHCPDGRQVPVEASAAPVRDPSGELLNVVVTLHDCSGQRQIEQALQERLAAQERFEHIAAVVPGAVHEFRKYPDGRLQLSYASHAFREIFGLDPELLREDAAALTALTHPEDVSRMREVTGIAAREPTPVYLEYRILTPHRGMRWVALSAIASRAADSSTLWHGVFTCVTERKRAEERLRTSQLQLHAALEAGDMGVLMIDLASGVVEMDATARRLWNLQDVTHPALTVRHLLSVIHPENVAAAEDEFRQMVASVPAQEGTRMHSGEYRLSVHDGGERWLLCRGRIYADESTGRKVKVGVIIDTTHQRRKEEQRLHSQKLEALGVLAGGIAHDFNNLLLAIVGNARLLLQDLPASDPMRTSVYEIDKAAARAAELVRRILSFSSVHDSAQGQRVTALRPVLDEVLGLARAVLPATVSIQSGIPDALPAVAADSSQVHQALINLLTNAADAAATADGIIRVQVGVVRIGMLDGDDVPELQPGDYVRILVSDRGSGIDRDLQQKIFDPFFTTKPTGKGTGLGLATVHGIMKSVEGAVTVDSEPGHGATFSLYFPVHNHLPAADQPRAQTRSGARKAHILYVDDEESLVFLMTRTLQRMGHRVTACAAPEQALAEFRNNADDFDLVVSDMAMPGMSGLDLAEQVLAIRSQLPFVITSGYVDAAAVVRAQEIGVRQMIMKPNTVDELSELLNAILREEGMANA